MKTRTRFYPDVTHSVLSNNSQLIKPSTKFFDLAKNIHTACIEPVNTNGNLRLGNAINNLIDGLMKNAAVKITFKCIDIFECELSHAMKLNVFTIVEKYLNTIIHQKNVIEINIVISQNKSRFMLSIADDNVHLDVSEQIYSNVITMKDFLIPDTGNLNLICNPSIGNCLLYHLYLH